jgi:UDP-2,3-diacylglucosamine hydrolase
MKQAYFISDIHLGFGSKEEDTKRENRLLTFLDEIKHDCSDLYILGDLFDFWFEYRRVVPKGHFRTLAKLYEFEKNNIKTHYLVGNHDCLLKDYFEKEIGIKIYWESIEVKIFEKNFFIHHGDGLSNNDTGYKILKKILRNKTNQYLFSLVHPDLGISLGNYFSKKSRHYTSKKDYGEKDALYLFAEKKIQAGFDFVILGHIHKLAMTNIDSGTYINLGDWINHYSYGSFDGTNFLLKQVTL